MDLEREPETNDERAEEDQKREENAGAAAPSARQRNPSRVSATLRTSGMRNR
ncbi:MAG: hypothetical protein JWM74_4447 [Myxococcaceae bacterium]|nr:hypothetical protein [Myxococcaceae bacterium]